MATRADIAKRALIEIRAVAAGETPVAEDQDLAERKFDAVHQSLGARGLLRWTLTTIPPWAEEPLVQMTATLLYQAFGKPTDGGAGFASGEAEIRRCIQVDWSGDPVMTDYF